MVDVNNAIGRSCISVRWSKMLQKREKNELKIV